jgi:hypothetical protein
MSKKVKFVWVKWLDASVTDYWASKKELGYGETVEAAGFLIKENKKFLCVGLQKDSGKRSKEVLEIPKKLIVKRRRIK